MTTLRKISVAPINLDGHHFGNPEAIRAILRRRAQRRLAKGKPVRPGDAWSVNTCKCCGRNVWVEWVPDENVIRTTLQFQRMLGTADSWHEFPASACPKRRNSRKGMSRISLQLLDDLQRAKSLEATPSQPERVRGEVAPDGWTDDGYRGRVEWTDDGPRSS